MLNNPPAKSLASYWRGFLLLRLPPGLLLDQALHDQAFLGVEAQGVDAGGQGASVEAGAALALLGAPAVLLPRWPSTFSTSTVIAPCSRRPVSSGVVVWAIGLG